MKIGSLFSGIGGLELGVLAACPGSEVIWQAECDPYALAVLAHHWPSVKRYTDVRQIDETAEHVDIICGGFPCQPHSLAGKRKGTADERWIWPEFARIIQVVKPTIVFIENVPGLRTSGLRSVLADLAELGFDAEWDLFQAAEAGGPHRRRRLFIFAYSNSNGFQFKHWRSKRESRSEAIIARVDGPPWVAPDCNRVRGLQSERSVKHQWRWASDGNRWTFESPVPGVAYGIRRRMDRHRLTGNAVVPQQAALAFRELIERAS